VRFDLTLSADSLPFSLALLAVFWFVGESFSLKELLFSRRKNKHHTAIYTHDISVSKRHSPPSMLSRFREGSKGGQQSLCENWMRVRHVMSFNLERMPGT
jgi:hypothetical protein